MTDVSEKIHRHNPARGPTTFDAEPPTEKMLAYAEDLARQAGIALPPDATWNRGACGRFIAAHAPKRPKP